MGGVTKLVKKIKAKILFLIFISLILTNCSTSNHTKTEKKKYPGLTKFGNGIQIAGSKVFEFKWIIIEK